MDQSSCEQQAFLLYLEFTTKSVLRWKLLPSRERLFSPEDEEKIVSSMTFLKKKTEMKKRKLTNRGHQRLHEPK